MQIEINGLKHWQKNKIIEYDLLQFYRMEAKQKKVLDSTSKNTYKIVDRYERESINVHPQNEKS
jgi:hypothetical protein